METDATFTSFPVSVALLGGGMVGGLTRSQAVEVEAQRRAADQPMRGYVAAAEGDLIGTRLIGCQGEVLPVLLEATPEAAFPMLLQGRVYADFREVETYFDTVFELILSLYGVTGRHAVAEELRESLRG